MLFRFASTSDKNRIWAQSPWAFDKNLMLLSKLAKDDDPMTMNLDWCEFHVQVSGLPVSLLHGGIAEFLGNAIGRFVKFDSSPMKGFVGSALRFRVLIDVTKPVCRMIMALGPDQKEFQVHIKYERLPNFCYHCGVIGHLVRDCWGCLELCSDTGEVPEELL